MAYSSLYITKTEADTYFTNDLHFHTIWSGLDDATKNLYIYAAIRYLDNNFDWSGSKYRNGQEFEFPRDFSKCWLTTNLDDYYYKNHGIIPDEIKKACFLLIVEAYNSENTYKTVQDLQNQGITSFSDGNTSMSFGKNQVFNFKNKGNALLRLIYPLTTFGWSFYRG